LNSGDFRAKQANQLSGECRVNVLPQGHLLNLLVSARSISHKGMLDIFLGCFACQIETMAAKNKSRRFHYRRLKRS